jgi:hypothetical protein
MHDGSPDNGKLEYVKLLFLMKNTEKKKEV